MITVSQFRSFIVSVWEKKNYAMIEYSIGIGMLVISICILKIKCSHVDLVVAGLMRYFFFL